MANFEYLEDILKMDFSQMRAWSTSSGEMRATDDAIFFFVTNLNMFFNQFDSKPSEEEKNKYRSCLEQLVKKINESEYEYFKKKYSNDPDYKDVSEKEIEELAKDSGYISSIYNIPARMQFWARAEERGDSIRNAEAHRKVVSNLNKWSRSLQSKRSFFADYSQTEIEESPTQAPKRLKLGN
ncbi:MULTISPECIES: hypothetical protein [unclassified Legionella]|uniref:hypothetical protein n=1 Tax=unclassified Legionella TaxID=2622702 RepID=UPI0010565CB3|nr:MULTISPECIES: hypothetical protein [unclassified Legionella]MDI9818243.1 hypothetical protein [Legionella sp. PL877]